MEPGVSVYARKNSQRWYVAYFCAKRRKRICEATSWRFDNPEGRKHALRYGTAKAAEARAAAGTAGEEWGAWVQPYLDVRYRTQAATHLRYSDSWALTHEFLESRALEHPRAISYNTVLEFIEWRVKRKRPNGYCASRNTALSEVKIWGIIFEEAVRRGFATVNPCRRLGIRRDPPAEKAEITDGQARLIREIVAGKEAKKALQDRWMTISFQIAMLHGCRLRETQIPMNRIDFVKGTITFHAKQKKVYTNRIHPELLPLLLQLRAAGAKQTCVLPSMASVRWGQILKAVPELSNLCFHCTRVTVITRLARAGVPIQQAMRYVGHASQTVHRIYQRLQADDLSLCSAALSCS